MTSIQSHTTFIVGLNHDRNQPLSIPIKNKKIRSRGTQTLKEKSNPKPPAEECPVCYKKMGKKDFVITKCGHKFCSKCIFTNFGKSQHGNNCPMCRVQFAPKFCASAKLSPEQITHRADKVMDKFWKEDQKLFRTSTAKQRRQQLITNNYEEYLCEDYNRIHNLPYLQLVDYIRKILTHSSNRDQKFNKLHALIDEFVLTSFSQSLAETMDMAQ